MLAAAKHYPGRGEVELIPGTEFTINPKPSEQVQSEDLLAFRKAIDAGVAFIMSEHIADESVTLLVNRGVLPLRREKLGKVLHVSIQKNENDPAPPMVATRLQALVPVARGFQFRPGVDPALYGLAVQAAREADTVIESLFYQRTVYKDNGPLPVAERKLVEDLCRVKPRSTVVMAYGNPYLVASAPEAPAFMVGYGEGGFYGNQVVYAESFIRLMTGDIAPKGLLPVNVSADFPIGTGIRY